MSEPDARPIAGRARGGTNMGRARTAILAGTARCLVRYGSRKTTMGDVAREAGVAKATLYNHFRAKPEVYAALLAAEVDGLLAEIAALPAPAGSAAGVRDALALAATRVSSHPVVRALAEREPDLAAALATPREHPVWDAVRRAALHRISLAQAAGSLHPRHEAAQAVDTVVRWVVAHVFAPASPDACAVAAGLLVQGLVQPPYAVAADRDAPHAAGPADRDAPYSADRVTPEPHEAAATARADLPERMAPESITA